MAAHKKTRIIIGVGAVAVIGGIVAFNVYKERRRRVDVRTEKVATRDLVSIVSASGEVRPRRFVDVSANVSGRITDLRVREGDAVSRGQVLARIDSTRFEAEVQQAEAGLGAVRAELDRALADVEVERLGFARAQQTHAQELISEQSFDEAKARLEMKLAAAESLRRQIAQQEALLLSFRDNLEKTTLFAPMDGVVTNLAKEEGEVVIGAQSFQPTVIMTVADLSVMECEILVDETDIRSVALGQPAEIEVDAYRDTPIRGHVTEIGSSAIPRGAGGAVSAGAATANQAKDFKVVVTLDDPPDVLRPGLNATADIRTGERPGALAIPIQAIVVRPIAPDGTVIDPPDPDEEADPNQLARADAEEVEGVFVVEGRQAFFRRVETGLVGETHIEIVSGLRLGDEVVTGSYKTLRTLKNEAQIEVEEPDET